MNRLSKEGHIVEELSGVRCSIVEKNVSPQRVEFLKKLLEYNGYTVMVAQTPPPPAKPAPKVSAPSGAALAGSASPEGKAIAPAALPPLGRDGGGQIPLPPPPAPNTFTVGVTNISFHAMLAVYERSLFTPEGKPVSIAYWNQEAEKPEQLYWERRAR